MQLLFWAGKKGNYQNFDPSKNICLIFMGMKQEKKIKNGRLKITEFFNSTHSQYFFKISWIGPWLSRID